MLKLYVWIRSMSAGATATSRDDRGAVSVEQAILIGVVATVAIGVGTALTLFVTNKTSQWSGL